MWISHAHAYAQAQANRLTIKVGIPNALPGFEVTDKGGLIITDPLKMKFSNCMEKQLKAHFIWSAYPTARVESMLTKKELDLIFPFQITEERKAHMLPSIYVWKTSTYFLANKNIDINDKNVRVGVRVNSPEHTDMLKKGYTKITTPYDFASLSRMLSQHLIDLAVVPEIVFTELKEQWPKDAQVTHGLTREAGYFLNKDDPKQLFGKLNAAISYCRFE
jgi:ABC-type amino acid transport substrate-binding protein